jgi:hypothetical protein
LEALHSKRNEIHVVVVILESGSNSWCQGFAEIQVDSMQSGGCQHDVMGMGKRRRRRRRSSSSRRYIQSHGK